MLKLLPLVLLVALGCGGDDPTDPMPTPTPVGCTGSPVLSATPVAGFSGLYVANISPAGSYDLSINGVSSTIESGALIVARSGDLLQVHGACGFSSVVIVR